MLENLHQEIMSIKQDTSVKDSGSSLSHHSNMAEDLQFTTLHGWAKRVPPTSHPVIEQKGKHYSPIQSILNVLGDCNCQKIHNLGPSLSPASAWFAGAKSFKKIQQQVFATFYRYTHSPTALISKPNRNAVYTLVFCCNDSVKGLCRRLVGAASFARRTII
jgi:hypothetical protein